MTGAGATPTALTPADLQRPRPTLMWFGSLIWVVALLVLLSGDGADCTQRYGCPPDWVFDAYLVLPLATVLVLPVLLRAGTVLSCVCGVATAALVVVEPSGAGSAGSLAVVLIAVMSVLLLAVVETERRRADPGPTAAWPGPPGFVGGQAWRVAGAVVAGLGALLVLVMVPVGLYEHHREADAAVQAGEVVAIGDDGYTIEVRAGGKTAAVDVSDSSGWQVGDTDDFFVDEDGPFRYAGDPFSAVPAVALGGALAGLGAALLVRARQRRRADRDLQSLPVRAARVVPWGVGALVFGPEASAGFPIALLSVAEVVPHPAPTIDAWPVESPERALVYGTARKGHPLYIRTRDSFLVPRGPVR